MTESNEDRTYIFYRPPKKIVWSTLVFVSLGWLIGIILSLPVSYSTYFEGMGADVSLLKIIIALAALVYGATAYYSQTKLIAQNNIIFSIFLLVSSGFLSYVHSAHLKFSDDISHPLATRCAKIFRYDLETSLLIAFRREKKSSFDILAAWIYRDDWYSRNIIQYQVSETASSDQHAHIRVDINYNGGKFERYRVTCQFSYYTTDFATSYYPSKLERYIVSGQDRTEVRYWPDFGFIEK